MTVTAIGLIPEWTFADRLRKARHAVPGLTQRRIADQIGVTPQAYSQWEAGNNQPRDIVDVARKVEGVTGVSATWLLGFDGPRPGDGKSVMHRRNGQSTGIVREVRFRPAA